MGPLIGKPGKPAILPSSSPQRWLAHFFHHRFHRVLRCATATLHTACKREIFGCGRQMGYEEALSVVLCVSIWFPGRAYHLQTESLPERNQMKDKLTFKATLVVALLAMCPAHSWSAEDGAALYKSKCAVCHGANGEGKPAMKAPALKGTTLTPDKISEHITKGEPTSKAPHNKGISGVSDEQAKAIAEYVKTLK